MYPRSYQLPDLQEHTVSKGTSYHAETRQDPSPSSRARWWSWAPQKIAVYIRPIWNDFKKLKEAWYHGRETKWWFQIVSPKDRYKSNQKMVPSCHPSFQTHLGVVSLQLPPLPESSLCILKKDCWIPWLNQTGVLRQDEFWDHETSSKKTCGKFVSLAIC